MDKEDKQNIRAEEYEEKISYAPGWPPQPTAAPAVDPHLEVTLDDIEEDQELNEITARIKKGCNGTYYPVWRRIKRSNN